MKKKISVVSLVLIAVISLESFGLSYAQAEENAPAQLVATTEEKATEETVAEKKVETQVEKPIVQAEEKNEKETKVETTVPEVKNEVAKENPVSVQPKVETPVVEVKPLEIATEVKSEGITELSENQNQEEEEVDSLRSHDNDVLKDFTGTIRQAKPYYCGPAALATVFAQMGKDIDQEKIAEISGMDEEKGTTLYGLKKATKQLGYIPVVKKWDFETLRKYIQDSNTSVVVHDIKSGDGHFTVLREITEDNEVELSDTEAGNIKTDAETFKHAWTGYVLIVTDEIDHELLEENSKDVSDEMAKTIWGTYVLVSIGDKFNNDELRALNSCIDKAERKSSSSKRKEAKKICYRSYGATGLDSDDVSILEKYGFTNLKKKAEMGYLIMVTDDESKSILKKITDQYETIKDIRDDIKELEDSRRSKENVLEKVDNKLEDLERQLIRLDKDYKAMKSSYNKASSKKKKELKKDLENLDKKIDRLEAQIYAEKKRIQNETLRLRREIQQLNTNINRKKSTLNLKEEYIRYDVSRLKRRVGYQETLTAVRDEERDIASGYADALTNIARALDVASIISPVSVFDICSAYTGKDCVDDEDVTKFGKVFVYGSLVPVGGKVLKVNKITKNGKKVLEVLEVSGKSAKIKNIEGALGHIMSRHFAKGAESVGKSLFDASEDIEKLIKNAEKSSFREQSGGNFERIIDAGRNIGIDRSTGKQTSIYTVITKENGDLVTAFPGRP